MKAPFTFDDIIGYEEVKKEAKKLARTEENILIIGESGVGKRLFASAIHNESRRKGNPFIVVESPSDTHSLFESELFGHRKGAFTDAKEDRAGIIESANGGTIFFDEIGDLPIELQPKILRVIEEKKVRRIGENFERGVDVRFIFATNRDLWEGAKERRFRDDLLHRIETFVLRIPPLRERKREEIEEIAKGIWRRLIEENSSKLEEKGLEKRELTNEEIEILLEYHFPGNIRDLEKILKRILYNWIETPTISRAEIVKEEIEKVKREWREREEEWHSKRIYKEVKEGRMDFWDVRDLYLNHEINKYQLQEIISYGLQDGDGTLKGVLPIFRIEERDYKRFKDFLRNQGITKKELIKRLDKKAR